MELKGFQQVAFNCCSDVTEEMAGKLPTEWPADKAAVLAVLVAAGFARGKPATEAAEAIWAMAPNLATTSVPQPAVGQDLNTLAQAITTSAATQAQALKDGILAMADAQTSENYNLCGSCGERVDKQYTGDVCPACGGLLNTGLSECGLCGTAIPSFIKGARVCVNPSCGAPLVEGDQLNGLKYLIGTQRTPVLLATKAWAEANEADRKKWARFGAKVQGYVVARTQEGNAAQTAAGFRADEYAKRVVELRARW